MMDETKDIRDEYLTRTLPLYCLYSLSAIL